MVLSIFEKDLLLSFNSQSSSLDQDDNYSKLFQLVSSFVSLQEDDIKIDTEKLPENSEDVLSIGVELAKFFIQQNFTGPLTNVDVDVQSQLTQYDKLLVPRMVLDGEAVIENVRFPSVLFIAERILDSLDPQKLVSVWWWRIRIHFLHERILEEKSNIIWREIQDFDKAGNFQTLLVEQNERLLATLYFIELAHVYLFHYDVTKSKELITLAATSSGIQVSLAGALGKRTRYQQNELAQLIVQVQTLESIENSEDLCNSLTLPSLDEFPRNLPLNDDTRLNKIQLSGGKLDQNYSPFQQIILLSFFLIRKRFYAKDEVSIWESQAFLDALLDIPKVWTIQFVSLLHRSVLEKDNSRTVGRSMEQLELLNGAFSSSKPNVNERLKFFFASHMPLWFETDTALAEVYKSLGSVNSALEVYLKLHQWESAIEAYNTLQLRHKAEEIIRQELEKGETVKLLCLLGDATDQTEYYEKAWLLSKEKSSRVQRQWGYFYYYRKQYEEAVPHLEIAVNLNPLEYPVWMRLAYSAMQISNWELCAKAYRHACILDSDNFESWNNLSSAYIHLGDKQRALKVLVEATKCDFNVWQVWDNLAVVATDCRAFDEVIRSCNRLLDLRGKHADVEILGVLTRFICQNLKDANGLDCFKYHKSALKLFGRITASITTNGALWKLYSDLLSTGNESDIEADTMHRSVDCAQKSVRCLMQENTWNRLLDKIKVVVEYSLNLGQRTLEFLQKHPESSSVSTFKTTAIFTLNRVLSTLKTKKNESIEETNVYDQSITDTENMIAQLNSTST